MKWLYFLLLLFPVALANADDSKWQDNSPHSTQFVQVAPDVKLEVLDWGGKGTPIIYLAGLGLNAHSFDGIAPSLTANNRVLAITRRGHGNSSWPKNGYDYGTLSNDIIAVLDQLKINKAILAGHSSGGLEITKIATNHPKRVTGLIYIDAIADYTYFTDSCKESPKLRQAIYEKMPDYPAFENTQLMRNDKRSLVPFASPESFGKILKHDHVPNYTKIKVPAVAISYVPQEIEEMLLGTSKASHDCIRDLQRMTYSGINIFVSQMTFGKVVAIQDSNHVMQLVTPDKVITAIQKWLAETYR